MERAKRNLNLDLLRIVCMLMVVCLHACNHGGLLDSVQPGTANYFVSNIIFAFCLLAVNCFVMLSGYFLCTSSFKLKKLVQVWGTAIFYSLAIYFVLVLAGLEQLSIKEVIKHCMVLTLNRYWFITAYLLMFMVFPFLNCAIKAMNKKTHLMCCCALLFIFSFLHNLVYISDFGGIEGGYSFLWFCILYIVAAYFRLYVPERIKRQRAMLPGYILASLAICGERFVAYYVTPYIFGSVKLTSLFYSYNSICVVAATLCLFQFFRGLSVEGKVTNRLIPSVAPLVFAVYLIHEQPALRPHLWEWLNPGQFAESPLAIPYVIACAITIFSVCCVIEWIRKTASTKFGVESCIVNICDRVQARIEEIFAKVG